LRIVFMGSPAAAVPSLEALVLNHYNVIAVYTQPDRPAGRGQSVVVPPIKQAALRLGLPVIQVESIKQETALEELAGLNPDVIVVCAFGQILPQALLDIPTKQCINVHFSLLPRHRGAAPVAAAILAGDEFTGVSIQLVRMKLDTGPILTAASLPIFPEDNTGTLLEKLSVVSAGVLQEALTGWWRGEITPQPQNEAEASYFSQVKKEAGELDWSWPAITLWRRIRAFNPWPGGYTSWRGKTLKIVAASPTEEQASGEKGSVMSIGCEDRLGIITGEGVLEITRLQLSGKKVMTAAEFLRGQRDFVGSVLPD
jgi:methionyl-tRNA formyltransferase